MTTCTYTVPTKDPDVDRHCGRPAVGSVELPDMTLLVCKGHAEKVERHGQRVRRMEAMA